MITHHKHHIIPRHAGGTDDPDNLVTLTVAEHAKAHKELYEQFGRWQDRVAWKVLSGQIGFDEAIRQAQVEANSGPKTGRRLEAARENAKLGMEARRGMKDTPEVNAKRSKSLKELFKRNPEAFKRPQYNKIVIGDDIEYPSCNDAASTLGISRQTVYNRVKSDKFPGWRIKNAYQ